MKERQAAVAAAAEDATALMGGGSRKASGDGNAAPAIATENGEGDGLSISSSVVQVRCGDLRDAMLKLQVWHPLDWSHLARKS